MKTDKNKIVKYASIGLLLANFILVIVQLRNTFFKKGDPEGTTTIMPPPSALVEQLWRTTPPDIKAKINDMIAKLEAQTGITFNRAQILQKMIDEGLINITTKSAL